MQLLRFDASKKNRIPNLSVRSREFYSWPFSPKGKYFDDITSKILPKKKIVFPGSYVSVFVATILVEGTVLWDALHY